MILDWPSPGRQRLVRGGLSVVCMALSLTSAAVDFSLSGYGTLGYARSNNDNEYRRFINSDGTVKNDSILGAQIDAQISPQWSTTVQAKLMPRADSDQGWQAALAWAFVSWRPSSDWLFRAGKLRVPTTMNAENMDVGVTFDYARLPVELYGIAPAMDFYGVSATRTWNVNAGEINLEAFSGRKYHAYGRFHIREGIPGVISSGNLFQPSDITDKSLTLTLLHAENTFSVGYHRGTSASSNGFASDTSFPLITLGPGVQYYQISGPGVNTRASFDWSALYLGANVALPGNFSAIAEYGRERVADTDLGANVSGYSLGLLNHTDRWTPYISYSSVRSAQAQLDLYASLNSIQVPIFVDPTGFLNATQRLAADSVAVIDQHTLAIGASYALSATSKLKGEWSRVHIGQASIFVDSPAAGPVLQQNISVYSFSYNFVY